MAPGMLKMRWLWALDGWSIEHFLGLAGSQIVPGKEEPGLDSQDLWGKEETKKPGVLFSLQRQPKSWEHMPAGPREIYSSIYLLPQQLSWDHCVPFKG